MNVIAVGALERAEVETQACWHDVSKHHVSMAFWAGTALDLNVDMAGHRTDFRHCVLPSKRRERNALSHRQCAYWWGGDRRSLVLQIPSRCSVLTKDTN